jgi:hypothetical protein
LLDCKERGKIPGTMQGKKSGSKSNQIINPKRDRRDWKGQPRVECTSFVVLL